MENTMNLFDQMTAPAADPAPATAPVATAETINASVDATVQAMKTQGQAEIKSIIDAGKGDTLGAKSSALVFLYMLGNPLTKSKRRVSTEKDDAGKTIGKDVACSTGIGFAFRATEDVEVPVIAGAKTTVTGYTESDLSSKLVKAGEIVYLTYLELFILAIKPEYSMMFDAEVNGQIITKGFRLDVKLSTFANDAHEANKRKLPSPSPSLTQGAVKATMQDICKPARNAAGEIEWIKPEYKEKFAAFFVRAPRAASAPGEKKDDNSKAFVTAAICRNIVADMLKKG